jgi:hypothetical protein
MPSDDEIRQILKGPGTSYWLKNALTAALDRDPVDAVNDAELLAMVLGHRAEQISEAARAEMAARDAIKRARDSH